MDDLLTRFVSDLVGRVHGPFTFRFMLQPIMAMLYAYRDGVKDARALRPPYFWAIFTTPGARERMLADGWQAVTRIIVLGIVMDAIYQIIVFRWIYPVELVVIVLVLAFVPYLLLRGPINRIARHWTDRKVPVR